MVVVRVAGGWRAGDGEQQRRRRGAVHHPCVVHRQQLGVRLAGLQAGPASGGVHRGVCRVFVNVREVGQWSGPGVAA